MRTLRRIELLNWSCYQGEHVIELQDQLYCLVAHRVDDRDRSNWGGKSTLLEAIDFCLYGRLNPDRQYAADDWITTGQNEGRVRLVFDDQTVAERSRKRGKATQLKYGLAKQDEAQQQIVQACGLSDEDFLNTCYFRQRQMSRFILARPEPRMEIVSAWFNLASLERAEEKGRARLSSVQQTVDTVRNRLHTCQEQIKQEEARVGGGAQMRATQDQLGDQLDQARSVLVARRQARQGVQEALRLHDWWVELLGLVPMGRALAEQVERVPVELLEESIATTRDRLVRARQALSEAESIVTRASANAGREFDGKCPVTCGVCPIKDEINADVNPRRQIYLQVLDRFKLEQPGLVGEIREAEDSLIRYEQELREHHAARTELERLRAQAAGLKAKIADRPDPGQDGQAVDRDEQDRQAEEEFANAAVALRACNESIARYEQLVILHDQLKVELEQAEKVAALHQQACTVFGRQGAQRVVAERSLARIENQANDMLVEAGIDLGVHVTWAREGQGLARTCDRCGQAFPASTKVKECGRCRQPRGPHQVNRLDVNLSDRSGAAEDLAGIAFQLSASRWLRDKRQSSWSTIMIDEPFSACDRANRKALAGALQKMLRQHGNAQALIVSHAIDTIEQFPHKIIIMVHRDGRRSIEVV